MKECTHQYFNMRICEMYNKGLTRRIISAKRYQDIYYSILGVEGVAHHTKIFKRGKVIQEIFRIKE